MRMNDWLQTWMDAGESGDAERARGALADDVVLVSPVTDQFVFEGAESVVDLLRDVFDVITEITYTRVERIPSGAILFAEAQIGDVRLNEAQFIDLDAETGRISKLTLFFRPLPAATKFLRRLGPAVARRQGHDGTARLLRATGAFLDSVAATGDRTFVPMAAPGRSGDLKDGD